MTTTSRFHWWTSLALLGLGAAMAFAFWGPREDLGVVMRPPQDANVLRVAYTQSIGPDPHRRTFPLPQYNQFILSLWEPLVECDPATNLPQPAAAAGWSWSPDQRILTLRLRPDARWSNGDAVTAHDFVRSWLHLLRQRKDVASALFPLQNAEAYQQGRVKDPATVGLRALDDLTLQLTLDVPRSTLVVELADPLLSPYHATSERVLGHQEFYGTPDALVTNGPFRLVAARADGFRLQVNRYFHGGEHVGLAGIEFIRADNLSMAQLLVAAGMVDLLAPTSFGPERKMPTRRQVRLESELEPTVNAIDFNVTRGPLRDPRVRRALALALDRVEPIKKYDPGHMVPAWSWVPDMPGRPGLTLLKEDPSEARRLLAGAGYPAGQGFPILRMALPLWMQGNPFPSAWAERWFEVLGIKTYISYESPARTVARMQAGDYDLLYNWLTATVPDAGDLLGTFLWPPDLSGTKWVDPEVQSLLAEANTRLGPERLQVLERAERRIMAAVPSVPVMFEVRQTLLAAEVRGWYADPLARQSLRRVWLDGAVQSDAGRRWSPES